MSCCSFLDLVFLNINNFFSTSLYGKSLQLWKMEKGYFILSYGSMLDYIDKLYFQQRTGFNILLSFFSVVLRMGNHHYKYEKI